MNPVEPKAENLARGWKRVVYAENQPEYIPLPSLQEVGPRPDSVEALKVAALHVLADPNRTAEMELCARWVLLDVELRTGAQRVVSVWEPSDEEIDVLGEAIGAYAHYLLARGRTTGAPRPRISLMSHVFGQPLQPIRMTVGEFSDPYMVGGLQPLDIVDDRTHAQKVADGDVPPGPPDPPKNSYRPVG